jgi:hypothetical protein
VEIAKVCFSLENEKRKMESGGRMKSLQEFLVENSIEIGLDVGLAPRHLALGELRFDQVLSFLEELWPLSG